MSNRCLYSFCKWGECHWALLPEPGGDQLLLQIAAAVAERAEGVSSLSLILCCEPLAGPNSIAPQTPSHLLRTAISATKTPPVCSMRCFRLSHVSKDQRESHVYQKEYLKIIQKSKPSSHVSNHGKEICVNIAVYFLEFFFFLVIIGCFLAHDKFKESLYSAFSEDLNVPQTLQWPSVLSVFFSCEMAGAQVGVHLLITGAPALATLP